MTELEKAAREELIHSFVSLDKEQFHYGGEAMLNMFRKGAQWQAKQSPWIRTEERLPEDNQLVLTSSGIYGTKLLEWNTSHALWFHEGGEDAYCEKEKIDAWMLIPE